MMLLGYFFLPIEETGLANVGTADESDVGGVFRNDSRDLIYYKDVMNSY